MDKKWQVFFLVALSIFMSTLDSSIVNVALPYIMTDMNRTMPQIQWVVTVYLLVVSSFLLTFGRLSDIAGRPKIYRTGFAVFTLGSFLCGISPGLEWLVFSRAVQGMGASMLMACSPALITDAFEPDNRGKALGLMGASVAAGLTLGPVTGGLLLEFFSWPVIFYINIPVGIFALGASWLVLDKKGTANGESLDILGSLFMVVLVAVLVVGLIRLPDWGLFSLKILGCGIVGVGAAFGFYRQSGRTRFPLLAVELFRIRLFVLCLSAALILFAALFFLVFMMPFYLSLACGFSPARTGMTMIVPFCFLLVVSPVAGALSDKMGSRLLCGTGMGCLAASLACIAMLTPSTGAYGIFWRLALAGLGIGLFVSPNSTALMGSVPAARRGVASGAMATARNLGMVMGVALASSIFSHTFAGLTRGGGLDAYSADLAPYFMTGFRYVMATGAAIAAAGIGVALARGQGN